jgi:hypothetical protein
VGAATEKSERKHRGTFDMSTIHIIQTHISDCIAYSRFSFLASFLFAFGLLLVVDLLGSHLATPVAGIVVLGSLTLLLCSSIGFPRCIPPGSRDLNPMLSLPFHDIAYGWPLLFSFFSSPHNIVNF